MFQADFWSFHQVLFSVFSFLAVLFAVLTIGSRSPVSSAFSLVMVLFNVAAIFAIQEAHFAAAIQILVYAGAIMVLFLFVVMLLNIDVVPLDFPRSNVKFAIAGLGSLSFFLVLLFTFSKGSTSFEVGRMTSEVVANSGGNIRLISQRMFSGYLFTFEIVAVLLLLAVVGAIVLAKRKID